MAQRVFTLGKRINAPLNHVSTKLDRTPCIRKGGVNLVRGFNGHGHTKMGHARNPTALGDGSYDPMQ
jgi:hypothetical protein